MDNLLTFLGCQDPFAIKSTFLGKGLLLSGRHEFEYLDAVECGTPVEADVGKTVTFKEPAETNAMKPILPCKEKPSIEKVWYFRQLKAAESAVAFVDNF
jgi:hypothetical protein